MQCSVTGAGHATCKWGSCLRLRWDGRSGCLHGACGGSLGAGSHALPAAPRRPICCRAARAHQSLPAHAVHCVPRGSSTGPPGARRCCLSLGEGHHMIHRPWRPAPCASAHRPACPPTARVLQALCREQHDPSCQGAAWAWRAWCSKARVLGCEGTGRRTEAVWDILSVS